MYTFVLYSKIYSTDPLSCQPVFSAPRKIASRFMPRTAARFLGLPNVSIGRGVLPRAAMRFQNFLSMHNVPPKCPFQKICTGFHGISAHFSIFFTFSISEIWLQNLCNTFTATHIEHFRQGSTNGILE